MARPSAGTTPFDGVGIAAGLARDVFAGGRLVWAPPADSNGVV
jgi:hypothetical protein